MKSVDVKRNGKVIGYFTLNIQDNYITGEMEITREWLEENLSEIKVWKRLCEEKVCDYVKSLLSCFEEYIYPEVDNEGFTYEAFKANDGKFIVVPFFPALPDEEDIEYVVELYLPEDVLEDYDFDELVKESAIFLKKFILCFEPILKDIARYLNSESNADEIEVWEDGRMPLGIFLDEVVRKKWGV